MDQPELRPHHRNPDRDASHARRVRLDRSAVTIQAADINGDGVPDLWASDATGTVTPYYVTGLTTRPAITAQPPRVIATARHTWQLSDIGAANSGSPVTGSADNTISGALPLTGAGNATWNTGDVFDPDVAFDGAAGSNLTAGAAIATGASFTVSAWVKPTTAGGTFMSQDGTNTAALRVWVEPTDNSWRAAMSTADVASPTLNTATTGPNTVAYGEWTNITTTYDHGTGKLAIQVNGVPAASTTHTTTWGALGSFQIGGSAHTSWFHGQISSVQTWNQIVGVTLAGAAAPALVNDNGDGTSTTYRWTSAGSAFTFATASDATVDLTKVGDRVATGDVDGDGHSDIVVAYQNANNTMQFDVFKDGTQPATVWYQSPGSFSLGAVGSRLVVGDFNGDGKAEPAMVYDNGNGATTIYRWLSTGTAFGSLTTWASSAFTLPQVAGRVAVGDVNGDGTDDIVMAYQLASGAFSFYVFPNANTSAGAWYTSGPFNLARVGDRLVVGDFNGDGKAEPALLLDTGTTMIIYRWLSTGTSFSGLTTWTSGPLTLANAGNRVTAGDVDGDGKDDVVLAYQQGAGPGQATGPFSYLVFPSANASAGHWYTSGPFDLGGVAGRLVLGKW